MAAEPFPPSGIVVAGTGELVSLGVSHPNGNVFDQVLLTGPSVTVAAATGHITRLSFIDLTDDIVQLEFSGAGTAQVTLEDASGPAAPAKYRQAVNYMKGHAVIALSGTDETTNLCLTSVGKLTAYDPTGTWHVELPVSATNDPLANGNPLFPAGETYDGIADVAVVSIASANGKFGGFYCASAGFFRDHGPTGLNAPGVEFTGRVLLHDLTATGTATPVLLTGAVGTRENVGSDFQGRINVAGGDMHQPNGQAVETGDAQAVKFRDNYTSHYVHQPARANRAAYTRAGANVTALLVENPASTRLQYPDPPDDDDIYEPLEPGSYRTGYGTLAESDRWLPFDRAPVAALRSSPRKVFAHYFLFPIQLTTHNEEPGDDPYTAAYLKPGGNIPGAKPGESGSWYTGGMFRQRPLPPSRFMAGDATLVAIEKMKTEIRRAIAIGVDGFAVEINNNTPNPASVDWKRINYLLTAASQLDNGFKIMLQPDMAIAAGWTRDQLAAMVTALARAYPDVVFKVGDRVVVCPFYADKAPYDSAWWAGWKTLVEGPSYLNSGVAFVPMTLSYNPTFYQSVSAISHGFSSWGARNWNSNAAGTPYADAAETVHTSAWGGGKIWMHPVAPQQNRPKQWWYDESSNTKTFRYGWEYGAIGDGAPGVDWADWVYVATWNDYSEGTELAPSTGTQTLFFDLMAYYVEWFKSATGTPPAIRRDCIYYSHRQHHSSASPRLSSTDATLQSRPFTLMHGLATTDLVEACCFLAEPADVQIEFPAGVFSTDANVPAGRYVKTVPVPAAAGAQGQPKFRIIRGGKTVAYVESRFPVDNTIVQQDFLYNGGSSLREPTPQVTVRGGYSADAYWPLTPKVLPHPWISWDIGAPARHGSADWADGVWTIVGGGRDIGAVDAQDQFRYAYRTRTGDFTFTAKVATLGNASPETRAGLVIRETEDPGAGSVMVLLAPDGRASFCHRNRAYGPTSAMEATGAPADSWMRLVRNGDTFTAYRSADGVTWTRLGTSQAVELADTLLVGLGVCSRDDGALSEVKFTALDLP